MNILHLLCNVNKYKHMHHEVLIYVQMGKRLTFHCAAMRQNVEIVYNETLLTPSKHLCTALHIQSAISCLMTSKQC